MKNQKEFDAAIKALHDGEFSKHKEKLSQPIKAAFYAGFRKVNLEYKLGLTAGKVSGEYAADMMTDKLLGQIESIYQGAARETMQEMQDYMISGGSMEEFEKKLADKIKDKIAGESITLPSGYTTTVSHYVQTITTTAIRQARDLGMKNAAMDSGIIDTNETIAISALLPTTCKYCRARHGKKIGWDEPILLHPNCKCSRGMRFQKDLGIPQVYNPSDFKPQPEADWQKLQALANMIFM